MHNRLAGALLLASAGLTADGENGGLDPDRLCHRPGWFLCRKPHRGSPTRTAKRQYPLACSGIDGDTGSLRCLFHI